MVGSPSPPSSLQGRSRQTHQFPSHQRSATADDNVTTVTRVMKSEDWPEFPCSPIVPDPCSHAGRPGCLPPHRREGIPWERGRLARILSLWPPLSFSAMLQAATLSAGTTSARPKESHGAVPG